MGILLFLKFFINLKFIDEIVFEENILLDETPINYDGSVNVYI
jgi:hypothetical protein